MKHLIFMLAALLPMLAFAADENDTTFTVKDKKIVVDVNDDKTVVTVYNKNGYEMSKTRELEFIDGQEVERVYVGSPFVPAENLQNIKFRPHYPTVWFGFTAPSKGVFSSSKGDTHLRRSKSFELGFTPWSVAFPFNKARTFGLTAAVQVAWVHQCFQKDYGVSQDGDRFVYTQLDPRAKGNNMNYAAFRLPVMLSYQEDYSNAQMSLGLSFEVRTNASYRLAPSDGMTTDGYPDYLRLRRCGLNLEYSLSIGPVIMSATVGLTPLFKTQTGTNAYMHSAKLGVDVLELCRMLKGNGKKK